MPKYEQIPIEVDAVQFWKKGDHPDVYSYATNRKVTTDENGNMVFGEVLEWAHEIHDSGLHWKRVHPGSWIVKYDGTCYLYTDESFKKRYRQIGW